MSLLQLAHERNWESILERVHLHPLELFHQDENGWNIFHHVCYRRPPLNVISALLYLMEPVHRNPPIIDEDSDYESDYESDDDDFERRFAMKPNDSGCTALHYACQYSSPEVVHEIVRLHPDAVSVTNFEGLTTLHYVYMGVESTNGSRDAFLKTSILLNVDPSLVTKNQYIKSPVALFCEKYEKEIKELLNSSDVSEEKEVSLIDFWKVLILLVSFVTNDSSRTARKKAEQLHDPTNFSTLPILHQLLRLPIYCNSDSILVEVLLVIVKVYPNQAKMTDMNGNLPLHSAINKYHYYPHEKIQDLIQALISAHPSAAQCEDSNGKLPFHLAVENGLKMNHGLRSIISANPGIVVSFPLFCDDERLFPYLLSTSANDGSTTVSFELLREYPNIFH